MARPLRAPRSIQKRSLLTPLLKLLGVSGVGIEDNFLSWAVNPFLPPAPHERIRSAWGLQLPIRSLLKPRGGRAGQKLQRLSRPRPDEARQVLDQIPLSFDAAAGLFSDRWKDKAKLTNIPLAYRLLGG